MLLKQSQRARLLDCFGMKKLSYKRKNRVFLSNPPGTIFSWPVQMFRTSYCTAPGIGVGGGISGVSISKMLVFTFRFLCDCQGGGK